MNSFLVCLLSAILLAGVVLGKPTFDFDDDLIEKRGADRALTTRCLKDCMFCAKYTKNGFSIRQCMQECGGEVASGREQTWASCDMFSNGK
uniref:Np11-2 n=1 Tax=Stichopus japonicus TaxID=307972 RepID=A0A2Z4C5L9_STIJA|nr:np11-2 precursor [Apostichopus japonicus]